MWPASVKVLGSSRTKYTIWSPEITRNHNTQTWPMVCWDPHQLTRTEPHSTPIHTPMYCMGIAHVNITILSSLIIIPCIKSSPKYAPAQQTVRITTHQQIATQSTVNNPVKQHKHPHEPVVQIACIAFCQQQHHSITEHTTTQSNATSIFALHYMHANISRSNNHLTH